MKKETETPRPQSAYGGRDYRRGRDNVRVLGLDFNARVFVVSAVLIVAFVVLGTAFQEKTAEVFRDMHQWIVTRFYWLFMIATNLILLFCLALVVSPLAGVRLGGPDAKPDYSYLSWFAMIFASSVSVGFMFFGVVEPVYHFQNPPLGVHPSDTEAAFAVGMAGAIFHWGFHGWAIYALAGLAFALFSYNLGMPFSVRSIFYPLFGNRVWGWTGHLIETLAVFSTLFGLAVSIGIGAEQITGGLDYLFGVPATGLFKVLLIAAVVMVAMTALLGGINVGIGRLSRINITLALSLMLFVIAAGPTLEILRHCLVSFGAYVSNVAHFSNWTDREDVHFFHNWTVFYWAWWFSYAPFVGMFVARISRGRTVREFLIFTLVLPTFFCVVWMNAFGGTAVHQFLLEGHTGVTETVAAWQPELALFRLLEMFPLARLLCLGSVVVLFSFLVVSLDSGSLAIDAITAGGRINAPVAQREFWCLLVGVIPAVLLLGGGLKSFQAAVLAASFPLAVLLVAAIFSVWVGLRRESRRMRRQGRDSRDAVT